MNKRIFIQKKNLFDVYSRRVSRELKNLAPNISCKVFVIYDILGIEEKDFQKVLYEIYADPVTDLVYNSIEDIISISEKDNKEISFSFFASEPLPGQYDQRADWAEQCMSLLGVNDTQIKTGLLYLFENVSNVKLNKIKEYLINPLEAREKNLTHLVKDKLPEVSPVPKVNGFIEAGENELREISKKFGFSLDIDDLAFIRDYFKTLKREPTETELMVLDTYWSDHCRHTTFETEITDLKFENQFRETLENTFQYYLKLRKELGVTKPIRLMDMATIMGKYLSKTGVIKNIDVSEEINACSIVVPIDVDGKEEEWLLQFKNETHNHPTEAEPYGGAATCIGGAIRDPLSGRAYVFQAMRVTGSGNPLEKVEDTLPGKLPQRTITREAAKGYSSYGNQIGLATTHVREIYDDGYKAKRMEVGFVAGAVKKDWVRREEPNPGDKVLLLGGLTGRDGVGGATGSSQTHDGKDIEELSSEVQKGNPIVERRIQRLFRNKEVLALIKRCNDFGAGGVSVAVGEIARGVDIDLNTLPLKYTGLNGTEIALSESQERMAVVVESKDVEKFIKLALVENLRATVVAEVTAEEKMLMRWNGDAIVEIERKFLDTNGVRKSAKAVAGPGEEKKPFESNKFNKDSFLKLMGELNNASQKGLVEMFDDNVGRGTVLNSLGGKLQDTPEDVSVQKFPTKGFTNAVSMASFGYNPQISRWSPYHGAYYAVIESVTKIIAGGGRLKDIRLTFQEYFESLRNDPLRWGKPVSALLGSIEAQRVLQIPAIGGKDSMSGSFKDIDVPPTLISFAVCPGNTSRIKAATLKGENSKLGIFIPEFKDNYLLEEEQIKKIYQTLEENNDKIISASTVKYAGIATTLAHSAFGNNKGLEINTHLELMKYYPGAVIIEYDEELNIPSEIASNFHVLGSVNDGEEWRLNGVKFEIDEVKKVWKNTFSLLFREKTDKTETPKYPIDFRRSKIKLPLINIKTKTIKPKVFIPVFPGTNSEYDSDKAFRKEGAETQIIVFKNLTKQDIEASVKAYAKAIDESQILFLPGGFSAADEPDGSGKYVATVLRNERVRDSIYRLLDRDGLILGVCNGFQGLIRSGLLPYGKIQVLEEDNPTLTFNEIGRHHAGLVKIRVNDSHSPWLTGMAGKQYRVPISNGEGRFVVDKKNLIRLFENNQIATQYVDETGEAAYDMPDNPNGSVLGIEGITSECGKIYGRMGHPERYENGLFQNIPDIEYMNIFKNGVNYFR